MFSDVKEIDKICHNFHHKPYQISKKIANKFELMLTAFHEAGHTVYALLHFMNICSVRVFQDKSNKRFAGFTYYSSLNIDKIEDNDLLLECLRAEIGLLYAGLITERYQYKLYFGSDRFPSFLNGASEDLKDASEIIKKYNIVPPGKRRYNYKKKILRKASFELKDNWDAVIAVAHALFQKKRLNFNDLKNILTKKTIDKDFWKRRMKDIKIFYDKSVLDENKFKSIIT